MHVKTGQTVKILTGKDKGKTGQVLQVFPDLNRVVVEGVNKSYKHLKRRRVTGGEHGERVEYFAPIHASNVKVLTESAPKEQAPKKTKKTASKSSNESKS